MLALLTEGSFESGRNDYGAYIKFPDGTLIMCGSVKINVTENNTYSGSATVKYPMSPSIIHYIGVTNIYTYSPANIWSTASRELSGCKLYFNNIVGLNTGQSADANWFLIGRWK